MTAAEYRANPALKFPDCEFVDCDQRTPEWHQCRKGRLTASKFGAWLAKNDKTSSNARVTAISSVLAEVAGYPDPPVFETEDIRRGIEMEPVAIQAFSKRTGLIVDSIGFAKSIHGLFGCSPDGIILESGEGVEIKCPRASKLIQYIQHGKLPEEYRAQVHGSMAVTGAKAWHFFAFHEGIPSFHIRVERDDYTDEILGGLIDFSNHLRAAALLMQRETEIIRNLERPVWLTGKESA